MATRKDIGINKGGSLRLATWATAAAVSLTLAGLAVVSTGGVQRKGVALATLTASDEPRRDAQIPRLTDIERERRQLNAAIRRLAADRDGLLARIASVERNLDDITGSIQRQNPAPGPMPQNSSLQPATSPAAAEPAPAPIGPVVPTAPEPPEWLAPPLAPWPSLSSAFQMAAMPQPSMRMTAAPAEPSVAAPPVATRTEYGVDIGSGSNLDEVRALWNAAKVGHPRLLGGLRPIVAIREDKTGVAQIRLIVGPLANAGAAAKLCASLGAADVMCSTRPFVGENLPAR
jgi:hypothetical protein